MKKWIILAVLAGIVLIVIVIVATRSGERYKRAYMAAGDGTYEKELEEAGQFTTTDDLNVVIKLNPGGDKFDITARFFDPNGDVLQEIVQQGVSGEAGTVILGIDYEGRNDLPNEWVAGRYRVELYIDGEKVDTLFFEVN